MAALLLALPAFPLDAGGPPCALADARAQAACEINNRPGKRERHLARMVVLSRRRMWSGSGPSESSSSWIRGSALKSQLAIRARWRSRLPGR